MKIALITECDYNVLDEDVLGADVIVFPFYFKESVSYNKEIKGVTNFFKTQTNLSKRLKKVVIAGVDTDSYGSLRHSASCADGGRLLGISDMTVVRDGERYVSGGVLRVYDTVAGRIGLLVGGDLTYSDCVKTLALAGADVIVNVSDPVLDASVGILARARAYEFGIPIAVCANKCAMLAAPNGEMVFTSPRKISVASVRTDKEYRVITLRRRGKNRRGS